MTDDTSDTDATAGPGNERPPPDRRRRPRGSGSGSGSGTEDGDRSADGADGCRCASETSGEAGVAGDVAAEAVAADADDVDGDDPDADPGCTEYYLGWLKLWRVVLLVLLAVVRLIRAL